MNMFKKLFSTKNGKSYLDLDLDKIKNSIESAEERILKEQEEFKKNAERTRAEIERGVRPSGKKFRL